MICQTSVLKVSRHQPIIISDVNENGEQNVFSVKAPLTIKKNVNLGCQIPANSKVEYRIVTNDVVASIDGENIYFDLYVEMNVVVSEDKSFRRVVKTEPNGEDVTEIKNNVISVYFPTGSDTLFDVARKFGTSAKKIAADNTLTEAAMLSLTAPDSLNGVRKLIIKR